MEFFLNVSLNSLNAVTKIFAITVKAVADPKGHPPSSYGPKCSWFHAFFGKIRKICMLALPPGGLTPPPTENPGSAPEKGSNLPPSHLLCETQGCYHSSSKTHVRDRILKLIPIHASVIYQIPWIHWIQWKFCSFRKKTLSCRWKHQRSWHVFNPRRTSHTISFKRSYPIHPMSRGSWHPILCHVDTNIQGYVICILTPTFISSFETTQWLVCQETHILIYCKSQRQFHQPTTMYMKAPTDRFIKDPDKLVYQKPIGYFVQFFQCFVQLPHNSLHKPMEDKDDWPLWDMYL